MTTKEHAPPKCDECGDLGYIFEAAITYGGQRRTAALIRITITPRRGTPDRFDAYVCDRLICSSRQPLLDAARVLLAEGIAPDTQIEMRHAGADHVALRGVGLGFRNVAKIGHPECTERRTHSVFSTDRIGA